MLSPQRPRVAIRQVAAHVIIMIMDNGSAYDGTDTFACPADYIYAFIITLFGKVWSGDDDAIVIVFRMEPSRIHEHANGQKCFGILSSLV